MKTIFTFLVLLVALPSICQWHDLNWIIGYDFEGDQSLSETMMVDFQNFPPTIEPFPLKLDFNATNLTVNDSLGNFLFYTNGIKIHDAEDELMVGGDSINAGGVAYANWFHGYTLSQGIMALPAPGDQSNYYLIHRKIEYNDSTGINIPEILYSVVDMGANNGKGAVTTKNNLIKKIFWTDDSAATKHANGQDWWVLTPDFIQNKIYSFRLSQSGIADTATQIIGYKPFFADSNDSGGRNLFSPDGSLFADFDARNGIRIYDFDRCTGELSNFRWVPLPYISVIYMGLGAAISPNSRYFYFTRAKHIIQLDLWASNIAASMDTIAEYQGWIPGQPPAFGDMLLTPDGKIYVFDFLKEIHVIHRPNEKGDACDFEQHAILLPEHAAGLPYYPNYRLGPLDGSPCDTLGLNNHPLAHFTWEADTASPLLVQFTDNSFYEPTDWAWDFGDGGTSTEVNPLHTFTAPGTYTICLTVSNQYDSDTFCREVTVGTVGVEEPLQKGKFELYPNPAQHTVTLRLPDGAGTGGEMSIYNLYGQLIASHTLKANAVEPIFSITHLSEGIYFVAVRQENGHRFSGKLIITR